MKIFNKIDKFLDEYAEYYSDKKIDWFKTIEMLLISIITLLGTYLFIETFFIQGKWELLPSFTISILGFILAGVSLKNLR